MNYYIDMEHLIDLKGHNNSNENGKVYLDSECIDCEIRMSINVKFDR